MKKNIFLFLFGGLLWGNSVALCAQDLSAMSFNIRYNNPADAPNDWDSRKAAVLAQIQAQQPDFLGTQEVLLSQLSFLEEGLVGTHKFIGVGRDDGKNKGEFSALFYNDSDWKLIASNTFWLSETPEIISVGWDAAMERICTYGFFEHKRSGKKIGVFNSHFDHLGEKARLESAKLILAKINTLNVMNAAVILMGDFNMTPDMPGIQEFKAVLEDPLDKPGIVIVGGTGTFSGFKTEGPFEKRIDYIFTKDLKVQKYQHLSAPYGPHGRFPSDHFAVLARLYLE